MTTRPVLSANVRTWNRSNSGVDLCAVARERWCERRTLPLRLRLWGAPVLHVYIAYCNEQSAHTPATRCLRLSLANAALLLTSACLLATAMFQLSVAMIATLADFTLPVRVPPGAMVHAFSKGAVEVLRPFLPAHDGLLESGMGAEVDAFEQEASCAGFTRSASAPH